MKARDRIKKFLESKKEGLFLSNGKVNMDLVCKHFHYGKAYIASIVRSCGYRTEREAGLSKKIKNLLNTKKSKYYFSDGVINVFELAEDLKPHLINTIKSTLSGLKIKYRGRKPKEHKITLFLKSNEINRFLKDGVLDVEAVRLALGYKCKRNRKAIRDAAISLGIPVPAVNKNQSNKTLNLKAKAKELLEENRNNVIFMDGSVDLHRIKQELDCNIRYAQSLCQALGYKTRFTITDKSKIMRFLENAPEQFFDEKGRAKTSLIADELQISLQNTHFLLKRFNISCLGLEPTRKERKTLLKRKLEERKSVKKLTWLTSKNLKGNKMKFENLFGVSKNDKRILDALNFLYFEIAETKVNERGGYTDYILPVYRLSDKSHLGNIKIMGFWDNVLNKTSIENQKVDASEIIFNIKKIITKDDWKRIEPAYVSWFLRARDILIVLFKISFHQNIFLSFWWKDTSFF